MNKLERAAKAKSLLEDLTFREVHAEIRNELIGALEKVAFDDIDKQHELVLSLQLHKRQKSLLERWVDDGKMEQKQLDHQTWVEKMTERVKRRA
jgi:hypothetical protein